MCCNQEVRSHGLKLELLHLCFWLTSCQQQIGYVRPMVNLKALPLQPGDTACQIEGLDPVWCAAHDKLAEIHGKNSSKKGAWAVMVVQFQKEMPSPTQKNVQPKIVNAKKKVHLDILGGSSSPPHRTGTATVKWSGGS